MAVPKFQLSPEVQKVLAERGLSAEEVIRKSLHIKTEGMDAGEGVIFPEGTEFLAWYKGRPHWGTVKNGAFVTHRYEIVGEDSFTSVSGAAASITGRPTQNGWHFWMAKTAGKNEFVPIMQFRQKVAEDKKKK